MIKLAISGCCGKMGNRIINLVKQDKDFKIVALFEAKGHPKIGTHIENVVVSDDFDGIKNADVLIEFTSPEATIKHLRICAQYNKAIVIGTTGLSEDEKNEINVMSHNIPIVFSPNMSIGVNVLFGLLEDAAKKLTGYKVSIVEAHHTQKKDAPSGTAKELARIIQEVTKKEVNPVRDRLTRTAVISNGVKDINIKSIREGDIVGDHEVVFESDVDTISLSHSAKTRDIFAQGAITAAKWVVNKKKGLFTMKDVL